MTNKDYIINILIDSKSNENYRLVDKDGRLYKNILRDYINCPAAAVGYHDCRRRDIDNYGENDRLCMKCKDEWMNKEHEEKNGL